MANKTVTLIAAVAVAVAAPPAGVVGTAGFRFSLIPVAPDSTPRTVRSDDPRAAFENVPPGTYTGLCVYLDQRGEPFGPTVDCTITADKFAEAPPPAPADWYKPLVGLGFTVA